MPNLGKGRDHSELQDMYRRSLAASWAAQPGELPADQCIEDLFSGGDGWKEGGHGQGSTPQIVHGSEQDLRTHHRNISDTSMNSQSTVKGTTRLGHKHSRSRDLGRHGSDQSVSDHTSEEGSDRGRAGFKRAHEVDEFDIREDLVAWALPGRATAWTIALVMARVMSKWCRVQIFEVESVRIYGD